MLHGAFPTTEQITLDENDHSFQLSDLIFPTVSPVQYSTIILEKNDHHITFANEQTNQRTIIILLTERRVCRKTFTLPPITERKKNGCESTTDKTEVTL